MEKDEKDNEYRIKLEKEVNEGRKAVKRTILTQDLLDNLTIEELEEEIRMIEIIPQVDDLFNKVKALVKKNKIKKSNKK